MDDLSRRRILAEMGVAVWRRRPPRGTVAPAEAESAPGAAKARRSASAEASAAGPPLATARRAGHRRSGDTCSPGADAGTASASVEPRRAKSPSPAPERRTEVSPERAATIAELDWSGLEQAVSSCTACDLHQTRNRTVFGVGDPRAELLIVGEAPGQQEDRQGEPFVGPAGKLLDEMLAALGLSRDTVYIANTLKCRPPGNRDPRPDESVLCAPFLERQIALLNPRVVLAVGRIAAQILLSSTESLGRLRGRVHRYPGTDRALVVTYHPAYLLRSPGQKRNAWADLLLAKRTMTEREP